MSITQGSSIVLPLSTCHLTVSVWSGRYHR
jgi:hypothetical protein